MSSDHDRTVSAAPDAVSASAKTRELRIMELALSIFDSIDNREQRAGLLREIGEIQGKAGDWDSGRRTIDRALALVRSFPDNSDKKASNLAGIAQVLSGVGENNAAQEVLGEALDAAEEITDEKTLIESLRTLARVQHRVGCDAGLSDSLASLSVLASSMGYNKKGVQALIDLADFQMDLGIPDWVQSTLKDAWTTAQLIDDPHDQDSALEDVAKAYAKAGAKDRAVDVVRSIHAESLRSPALCWVARNLAETGDVDGAQSTAVSIPDGYWQQCAFTEIFWAHADLCAKAGDAVQARKLCDRAAAQASPREISPYYSVLKRTAVAQARQGDTAGARRTFEQVLDAIKSDRSGFTTIWKFEGVAEAQAQCGDLDGAMTTVQSINNPSDRTRVLNVIARVQARSGDTIGAWRTLRAVEASAYTLQVILAAQAEADDLTGAETTLQKMRAAGTASLGFGLTELAKGLLRGRGIEVERYE